MDITIEEWRAELEKIQNKNTNDGFTTSEICDATGKNEKWVRGKMKDMIISGIVIPIRLNRCSVLDGVVRPVPGFKIKRHDGKVTKVEEVKA